jgi:hypothetical protein
MAHSRAETLRVEERRAKVASMALQGLRPSEIARRLGDDSAKGRVKVSQDLKAVREAWRASAVHDFAEAKGRLLAEIAEAKRAAWRAWRQSARRGEDGKPRDGNVRFLNVLLDLFAKQAEILGLVKSAPMIVQQQAVSCRTMPPMTPLERADAVRAIIVAAARTTGPDSEAASLLKIMEAGPDGEAIMGGEGAAPVIGFDAGPRHDDAAVAPPGPTDGDQDGDGHAGRPPYGLKEWAGSSDDDPKPLFG